MKAPSTQSGDYKPKNWYTFDRDGNPVSAVIFASRSYTEYRDPSGRVRTVLNERGGR